MLKSHIEIFFRVADNFNCRIGVRESNPLSDRWIGRSGYIPKGQECKAKTSNNPDFHFGGLVVSPIICPEAFTTGSLNDTIDTWSNKFLQNGRLPAYFSCMDSGFEKGLLKYQGFPIHADYDLMYICKADKKGNSQFTDMADQQKLFLQAQRLLNLYFGKPMIQHGTELTWSGGVGAAKNEYVHMFGPRRNFTQTSSIVSKNVKDWH